MLNNRYKNLAYIEDDITVDLDRELDVFEFVVNKGRNRTYEYRVIGIWDNQEYCIKLNSEAEAKEKINEIKSGKIKGYVKWKQ